MATWKKPTADYQTVRLAIASGRLKVNRDGSIFHRRNNPKAIWRPAKPEIVNAPGRTNGYHRVSFMGFRCLAHHVVWFAFKGPIPDGKEINHKNGVKIENRISNLEVLTTKENNAHARALGLTPSPDPFKNGRAKITPAILRTIRDRANTEPQSSIARDLGLSNNIVNRVVRRKTFKDVE